MRMLLLGFISILVLAACTEYVPPPGGEQSYCYRIEYDDVTMDRFVFLTDTEPHWEKGSLVIQDVWFAKIGGGAARFDRSLPEISLSPALGDIQIEPRFWCLK